MKERPPRLEGFKWLVCHGYTVHGPQPRSYEYAFPRKKLLGALRSALAAKLADGKLTVVDTLEIK